MRWWYTHSVDRTPASLQLAPSPVPLEEWEDGSVRVTGTRLLYYVFLGVYQATGRPDDLLDAFPFLSLGTVYQLLGYYHEHRAEIDEWLSRIRLRGEEVRREFEYAWPSDGTREELKRRWADRRASSTD